MCGILTIVRSSNTSPIWPDETAFTNALNVMRHRGPDASGVWRDGQAILGHRRLSVIDLQSGAQPMLSQNERYVLSYNGMIYNYVQLRDALAARGHVFSTRSDTEVLLNVLIEWGIGGLSKLDGMFAFGLWDRQAKTLLVARDRVGIKPLFVSTWGGQFIAASIVAPFWALNGFPLRVDVNTLRDYFAQQFTGPRATILEHVKTVQPGTWSKYHANDGRIEEGRFWDIPPATDTPLSFDALVEETDKALRESVRRQLVSDVPLGVLFSGGIDSSLLTWYIMQVSNHPIKTFTVKFDQSPKHDEAPIARRVARKLGTDHHELIASAIDEDDYRNCIVHMDQPFGDASYLPVMKLAALARQQITVAIGGDGGDEVFGGYPRYFKSAERYPDNRMYRLGRWACERGWLPASMYRAFQRGDGRLMRAYSRMGDYPVSTRGIRSLLTNDGAALLSPERIMADWQAMVRRWTGRLDADSLMRSDLWYFLGLNGLVKTDRATMMASMEARVPILGNEVLDLVLPQPLALRLRDGLKSVLMVLAKRHLPRDVWDRSKRGFTVPDEQYMAGPWIGYCEHLVHSSRRLAPFIDADELISRWGLLKAGQSVDWPAYGTVTLLGWLESHPVDLP